MSNYTARNAAYLIDSADTVQGVLGPDGREWLFPATLAASADGASFLGFAEILFDATNTPVGFLAYGREFIFGSAFQLNTVHGYHTRQRALVISSSGQPIGVRSGAKSWRFPTPPVESGAAQFIGGVALGAVGAGIFAGFNLITGDDFDVLPVRYKGTNAGVAKYMSNSPQGGQRHLTDRNYRAIMMDPNYRGVNSSSPVALGIDGLSAASSIVTITAAPTDSSLLPYLPTDFVLGDAQNRPLLTSACLDSSPSFLLSAGGDFVVEAKISFSSGIARGWWPAFWTTTIINWPNEGEIDIMEARNDASGNHFNNITLHENTADGNTDQNVSIVSNRAVPANQMVNYVVRKSGTTLTFYDDVATPGTLAQVGTYTNTIVSRLRGSHRIRMELNVAESWDSSTFNIADWPQMMAVDWWRCWVPSASYAPFVAHTVLAAINTTPGGSWAATFPSAVSLYGAAPDIETIVPMFDNPDCPGQATKSSVSGTLYVPGGMTVDATARTITGTVPTDRGGVTTMLFTGSFTAGGQARAAMMSFNVAPAVQGSLFSNLSATYGQAVSQAIGFIDFHSGNLGPHSYVVTNDSGGWLTAAYGANNQSLTLSGTAPGADQTVTITINCTNSIGQTTIVTRTLTVAATASTFSDNFNRPDEDLSANANWTLVAGAVGKARVVSNIVQCQTTDSGGAAYLSPNLGSQRQSVAGNVSYSGFLCVQLTDTGNYIGVRRNSSTSVIEVFKKVSGTLTAQCAFAETVTFSDVVEIDFISNVLVVKKNSTVLVPTSGSLTVVSGPPASTRTGIVVRINNGINFCDNYAAAVI